MSNAPDIAELARALRAARRAGRKADTIAAAQALILASHQAAGECSPVPGGGCAECGPCLCPATPAACPLHGVTSVHKGGDLAALGVWGALRWLVDDLPACWEGGCEIMPNHTMVWGGVQRYACEIHAVIVHSQAVERVEFRRYPFGDAVAVWVSWLAAHAPVRLADLTPEHCPDCMGVLVMGEWPCNTCQGSGVACIPPETHPLRLHLDALLRSVGSMWPHVLASSGEGWVIFCEEGGRVHVQRGGGLEKPGLFVDFAETDNTHEVRIAVAHDPALQDPVALCEVIPIPVLQTCTLDALRAAEAAS